MIRFPLGLFSVLLAGQQRYDVLNIGNLLAALLYFVLAVVVLYVADGGLVALAVISVVAAAFRLLLPLFWLKRELPQLSLRRTLVTGREAKTLLSFSSRNMLIQVASKVVVSTDVIVVGVIFGSVAAGVYGIPAKLFALAYVVGIASTTLLFPVLSELEGADDRERQERYLHSGVRLGVAVVVAVGLPLVVLPDNFLEAWLPSDFDVATSAPILAILMVSLLFAQPGHLFAQFLVARGRHGRLAVARLATVVVNLLLSIGLALWVGLWGVALATLVTEARVVRGRAAVSPPPGVSRLPAWARRCVAAARRAGSPGGDPDPARRRPSARRRHARRVHRGRRVLGRSLRGTRLAICDARARAADDRRCLRPRVDRRRGRRAAAAVAESPRRSR